MGELPIARRREDGFLLTRIEPRCEPSPWLVERRAYRAADNYVEIITWQSDAGGKNWWAVECWELSPMLVENLLAFAGSNAQR